MTQKNNQSVRNAEAAENSNHIPTFDEVYAMPYVRESIRSLLMTNSMLFPHLASYEDDLRQDMLIFLAASLEHYNPVKSDIKTFCRMKLETGLIRARRQYRSESQKAISYAIPLDKLVDAEQEEYRSVSTGIRRKTEFFAESPFEKEALDEDLQDVLNSLCQQDRKICESLLDGMPLTQIHESHICSKRYLFKHALPRIRKIMQAKKF